MTFGLAVLAGGRFVIAATATAPAVVSASQPATTSPTAASGLLEWHTALSDGITEARRSNKPILVRAGAVWCGWCKELDKQIATPTVQDELRRWTLVYLDVDRAGKETRELAIGPVPAMRALTSSGRLMVSRDGYMEADDLIDWLKESYSAAGTAPPPALPADRGEATTALVKNLLTELDRRDPAAREAAIRRLMIVPRQAAGPVVETFAQGTLAARLAAMEILTEWNAPLDGLDPWRPETITQEGITSLRNWAARPGHIAASRPAELTAAQFDRARDDVARLLQEETSPAEAEALRERLARYGALLLPEVYAHLKQATTDRARERLTMLRYRLVATDELAFTWPGGLERLAALDVETRHAAAEELAQRATSSDDPLLLELFSDPDPLVREIALRGLQKTGGAKASDALARLLDDPEPNVRAAVLKQLAESPSAAMVPRIAEYVAKEKDSDLVVHAVRVLRAAKGKTAAECLITLLAYNSWQVRAEAAEAIGEMLTDPGALPSSVRAKAYEAMAKLLQDSDGFVVSRAIKALRYAEVVQAVDPLVEAADKHPELAVDVLSLLADSAEIRAQALPHIRRFCAHVNASVRAAAITALAQAAPTNLENEMVAALGDSNGRVRLAAAQALFTLIEQQRPRRDDDAAIHLQAIDTSSSNTGLLGRLLSGFRSNRSRTPVVATTTPASMTTQPATTSAPATEEQSPSALIFTEAATRPAESRPSVQVEEVEIDGRTVRIVRSTSRGGAPVTVVEDTADTFPSSEDAKDDAAVKQAGRNDAWIEQFKSGQRRPTWMEHTRGPLMAMLTSDQADERMAAAVALVALGGDEQALPVILATARKRPADVGNAAAALPWLTWDKRLELFNALSALHPGPGALTHLARAMATWPDPRAAGPLWDRLGEENIDIELASTVLEALRRLYYGDAYFNPTSAPPSKRKQVTADALAHVQTGPELQRVAALAMLLSSSLKEASAAATKIVDNPQESATLRHDAFQILLLSETRDNAQQLAAARLTADDPALRQIALQFLAHGGGSLMVLRNRIYLYFNNSQVERGGEFASGQPVKFKRPTHLDPQVLRPFLVDSDPAIAAYAGYLLALLNDPAGLGAVVTFWRERAHDDQDVKRLVFRAIVALGDDSKTPILEEVYRTYPKGDYWLREFYWTIRDMSGPQVLKLRKTIRDEVGMGNLK